ncbi:MAG: NADH-quinone oxidoreductase subunit E [Bacillota bacterium]|nr:MAG: NADH-quinone oxidoreductase subunit E [Bacillota bacterium]MBS3949520.1 NADH-quinone oxidoreductase subunit NuoE [Peptococcaceae bacterium]
MTDQCKCCSFKETDPRWLELERILEPCRGDTGALIQALHKAQDLFGFVSPEVQEKVAEVLNVPLSEVYGVATFYSLFSLKPRGENKIGVCLGTACYVRGAAQVLAELEKQLNIKLNDTTQDGKFTLEITRCIGACGLAPVITINEDVYGRLQPDKIKEILDKY